MLDNELVFKIGPGLRQAQAPHIAIKTKVPELVEGPYLQVKCFYLFYGLDFGDDFLHHSLDAVF